MKHTNKPAYQARMVKTHESPPLLNTTESRTLGQGPWVTQRPSERAAKPTRIVSRCEFLGWCLAAPLLSHHMESWSPCPAFGVGMGSLVLSWTNLTQACHLLGNQSILEYNIRNTRFHMEPRQDPPQTILVFRPTPATPWSQADLGL